VNATPSLSFFTRNEFLIRRWHSLTGLIPIGAYLVVHLAVNASLLSGPSVFQKNVYQIHGMEDALVVLEWAFIFLPILFHGIIGVAIWWSGVSNVSRYPYCANFRYSLQRITGLIALVFIVWHVFHLHGWFHADWWTSNVVGPLGGAKFRPFNAASTLAAALRSPLVQVLYAIGMLSSVYHFANGLWTMGITWGVWTSPAAQRRAARVCGVFGVVLALVGLAALVGPSTVDPQQARTIEDRMYEARVNAGEIKPNADKRSALEHTTAQQSAGTAAE
jgi:succinate dehydrogenase / fumarate reductase cytochrome b subunit